jgi:hypothetical protein
MTQVAQGGLNDDAAGLLRKKTLIKPGSDKHKQCVELVLFLREESQKLDHQSVETWGIQLTF